MPNNSLIIKKELVNLNEQLKDNKNIIIFKDLNKEEELNFNYKLTNDLNINIYLVLLADHNANIKGSITLDGINSSCNIINLMITRAKANIISDINIYHNIGNTTSNLETYAITKDDSVIKIINNGTIKKGSHKSVCHQSAKGLTLSNVSKIDANPNLYIDDFDVIASHACAIGSVNKEDLFYLMSRGLNEEEARRLIVNGYISPIIDHIEDNQLKEEILERIKEIL